ncbi:TnsA-like heteromeric transposase endonuclease subunit [Mycolicibacterium septicum]|nr:TnsA-like heteromeric transposase endonuclease subunit [Mycolicibacterium septicum]
MSSNNARQNGRGAADGMAQLEWTMRFLDGVETVWLWQVQGAPPLHQLASVRTPRSSASNRHIPVTAYTFTNSAVVHLESGLEHDLVRMLDRDSTVLRIISQPFQLSWRAEEPVTHFPDLLTQHIDGSVMVWDARPLEKQDDDFQAKSIVTRRACETVGWRYTVFAGTTVTERMNMLWIHGFRRKPPWAMHFEQKILRLADRSGATVGSFLSADDGTGELKTVFWHMVWTGALNIDMTAPWTLQTSVAASKEKSHA